MTPYEFRILPEQQQAEVVWQGELFLLREEIKRLGGLKITQLAIAR